MHHESTKALYDFYPPEGKNDFFPAYLYLRYPELFIYHASMATGVPAQEPAEKVDEILKVGANDEISQPKAVNPPVASKDLERLGEFSPDMQKELKRGFPHASGPN